VENLKFITQLQLRNATSQRNAIQVTKSKLTKENLRLALYFHPLFAFSEIVVDPKKPELSFSVSSNSGRV
jgi:hypothetical protein